MKWLALEIHLNLQGCEPNDGLNLSLGISVSKFVRAEGFTGKAVKGCGN